MPDIFKADGGLEMQMSTNSSEAENTTSKKTDLSNHKSTHKIPSKAELKKSVGYHAGPLAAFSFYPSKLDFSDKDKDEVIILLLRRHPITNLPWIVIAALMLVFPIALDLVPILEFLPPNFQSVAILIWYLLIGAFILEQFLVWFFNVNIVTDERVFDVDFHNLLYREISDAHLDQIQDVTVRMGSAIRTIFNYGDVLIQTAGEVPNLEFEAVPHPDRVAKILRELRVEEEVEKIEGRIR